MSPLSPTSWPAPASGSGGGAMALLSTTTLGSDGTFDVSGISAAYNDLLCVLICRGARASVTDTLLMRLNNDSGANYGDQSVGASGAVTNPTQNSSGTSLSLRAIAADTANAGVFQMLSILIPGYASTVWNKQVLAQSLTGLDITAGNRGIDIVEGLWKNTAAVARVGFFGSVTANLKLGSTLRIYGIL